MGELKATPGPWLVHPFQAWVSPASDPDLPICELRRATDGVPADERVTHANARLIAAAPELLDACERLLERYRIMVAADGPEAMFAAHVISKARTGEGL